MATKALPLKCHSWARATNSVSLTPLRKKVVQRALEPFNGVEPTMVVLEWMGNVDLNLHVLEDGASIGKAGHVWHGGSERSVGKILTNHNARTKQNPRFEVYSMPARNAKNLRIEVQVEFASLRAVANPPFCGNNPQGAPFFEVHVIKGGKRIRTSGLRQFRAIECGSNTIDRFVDVMKFGG